MVISVSLGAQSYPILLEAGALARAGQHLSLARRVLVVTDSGAVSYTHLDVYKRQDVLLTGRKK